MHGAIKLYLSLHFGLLPFICFYTRSFIGGAGVDFSEEIAKEILLEDEITVKVTLSDGDAEATAWGCDLTYEYVKINGDYRT